MKDANNIDGIVLYEDNDHKFIWLGSESKNRKGAVQTMQYLIIDHGRGVLLDPGGVHLFSRVVTAVSRFISVDKIDTIFFSHQDPDVSSGIALWLGVTKAKVYISGLWVRFMPHFGIVDISRIIAIPDKGLNIALPSGAYMRCIPSHFMHSPGQFGLYDERSRILFTGDIGAAVFEDDNETTFVEDFSKHIPLIEGFHVRYMASNSIARRWAETVRALNPIMIAPQHGAIYKDEQVNNFLNWISNLKCGIDYLERLF
ncbi:MBL fold metallo-hydrolase [Treponema pedis]|uniref:Metallo-beta-lactamase n=5 Tax=Treponema pedis TaxID=409322 RepID=S5ZXD2_9SPIR|nr:MBL fold metallo-hydrolase [Treponema pedis]AGT45130.1 metallo-beta-lactamase [Treponema pedis str. T A4]QOW60388.1 MBL fold metallo-hydrolase [Treponema pedis]QSI05730.1 MBL fold metallo-hydrolase [Treponema pedis]